MYFSSILQTFNFLSSKWAVEYHSGANFQIRYQSVKKQRAQLRLKHAKDVSNDNTSPLVCRLSDKQANLFHHFGYKNHRSLLFKFWLGEPN